MNDIILKPILTEKMADLGERLNRYAFEVDSNANKIEKIGRASCRERVCGSV